MLLTRKKLLVTGIVVACAVSGSFFGATFAGAAGTPPVAAFSSGPAPAATDQSYIDNLASDVAQTAPGATNNNGTPLTSEARDLISNAGPDHDTLGAFPTSSGAVCFEVLAAGACGRVDSSAPFGAGITFGILTTRNGGTRVYGVASDDVAKVDVVINGTDYPATLSNNGFYFALPVGVTSDEIQSVISTWTDGTVHTFPVHG